MTLEQALQDATAAILKLNATLEGAKVSAPAATGTASSTIGKIVAKQSAGPNGETRFFLGKKNDNLFKIAKGDVATSLPEITEISEADFAVHQKRIAEKFKTLSKKTAQAAPAASQDSADSEVDADESSSETDDSGRDFDPFADDAADDTGDDASDDGEEMDAATLEGHMRVLSKVPAKGKKASGRDRLISLMSPETSAAKFMKGLKTDAERGAFGKKVLAEIG